MRKHLEITKAADELYAQLTESFNTFAGVKKDQVSTLGSVSYDEAHSIVESLTNSARSLIAGCISSDGTTFPKYLTSFKTFDADGKLSKVVVTIKSKLKDAVKYKKEFTISVDDNFMDNFAKAHIEAIFEMYYKYQANANLEEVNEFIAKICTEHNIPYTFGFELADGKEYITYIDNDKVIFNANLESALEVAKNGIFQSGDEYFNLVRDQQIQKLVDSLSVTQTTTQLIKAKVSIIDTLIGYTTKKRADRLIRNTYHKKAEYFDKIKKGYGYFEKEDGDTSIFAILEKHEDGEITVALNPFNIKTLEVVDVDVVAEVKAMLA